MTPTQEQRKIIEELTNLLLYILTVFSQIYDASFV